MSVVASERKREIDVAAERDPDNKSSSSSSDDEEDETCFAATINTLTPAIERVVLPPKHGEPPAVEERAAGDMSSIGHILLIIVYYGAALTFIAFVIYGIVTAGYAETMSLELADAYGPTALRVAARCETAGTPNGECGQLFVTTNYSTDTFCGAANPQNGQRIILPDAPSSSSPGTLFYVCPSLGVGNSFTISQPVPLQTLGLIFEYDNFETDAFASLVISSVAADGKQRDGKDAIPALQRTLAVFENGVKAFRAQLSVVVHDGDVTSKALVELSYDLEGTREDTRSCVLLRVDPLAQVRTLTSPRTVGNVIGSVGGALQWLEMAIVFVVPLWMAFFAKARRVPPADVAERREAKLEGRPVLPAARRVAATGAAAVAVARMRRPVAPTEPHSPTLLREMVQKQKTVSATGSGVFADDAPPAPGSFAAAPSDAATAARGSRWPRGTQPPNVPASSSAENTPRAEAPAAAAAAAGGSVVTAAPMPIQPPHHHHHVNDTSSSDDEGGAARGDDVPLTKAM